MRKRYILIIILLTIFIIPNAVYHYFSYKGSLEYVRSSDNALPFYAQDKYTNKLIYVDSPKKFAASIISGEEYFRGDLKLKYLNADKAEITMDNYSNGDDSMTAIGYKVITERTKKGWKISEFNTHWQCRGYFFTDIWTIHSCP
jgi:hypothetical protein